MLLLSIAPAIALAANAVVTDAKKKIEAGKYEEAITALEAELKKNPKSTEVKTALSEAYTAHGESIMKNPELPPFRKYPQSLRLFRKAVEQDANNKKAKDNIAMIEGIYKQMGRPIPQ